MSMQSESHAAFAETAIPDWALRRPKPLGQSVLDLVGAPLRMAVLPDLTSEKLHLTSLRAERFAAVLPQLQGRVLDIGAGDNALLKHYRGAMANLGDDKAKAAQDSVGVDVMDWGGECVIVPDVSTLPFEAETFDTVCFIACLNHIPERAEAIKEAHRVLKPGGRVVVTMIGKVLGAVGHAIWWYSEDKHRDTHHDELPGMDSGDIHALISAAGFARSSEHGFVYGLNRLYVGHR